MKNIILVSLLLVGCGVDPTYPPAFKEGDIACIKGLKDSKAYLKLVNWLPISEYYIYTVVFNSGKENTFKVEVLTNDCD